MRNAMLCVCLLVCVGASATTQPDSYPALQKRLAALIAENDRLKSDIAGLISRNAVFEMAIADTGSKKADAAAKFKRPVEVGMTEQEALECFDPSKHPHDQVQDSVDSKVIVVYHFEGPANGDAGLMHKEPWRSIRIDKTTGKVVTVRKVSLDESWD